MKAIALAIGMLAAAATMLVGDDADSGKIDPQLLPMNTCMEEKSELFPSKTSAQIAALCELLLLG